MFSWAPYPFVRIVFFLTMGITVGIYFPDSLPIDIAIALFIILAVFYCTLSYMRSQEKLKLINPGFVGLILILLAGFIQVYNTTDHRNSNHFIHVTDTINYYKAVVIKQAQEKENSWKIEAEVQTIQHSNRWENSTGKVLLYFSKQAFVNPFKYGDVLLLKGSPQLLTGPANPGEFDYGRFLSFRKIYHQHFLRSGDVIYLRHQPPNLLMEYSIRARVWADEILKKYIHGIREQATASALVLGVTDSLDSELLSAYAATGSLHVLSVSGLHVGIIYWLLLLVLKPLNKSASGKWFLAIVSILILWGYAMVTGLSPSVLRAVTMFSFVAIAKPWSKRSNIYNTLALSACCLLLYEPYFIMSVGFQLSYLAVIGIVYLQPLISRWWEPKHWILDNIWQITSVSLAAQVATFALGLLYFHQFPVYFLFSNLFVIPASFIVLVLGIGLVGIGGIAPVAGMVGYVLEWTIRFMNYGVVELEALPFSLIDNVYITIIQCWLLIVTIVFVIILIELRSFHSAVLAVICILVFSGFQWGNFQEVSNKQTLTIYKVAGHSAWDIIDNGHAYFFTDSVFMKDENKIHFHIRPNRLQSGVNKIYEGEKLDFARSFKGCRLVVWRKKIILQILSKDFSFPKNTNFHYVIVSNNSIRALKDLSSVKFKKLILDSSNSFYISNRILQEASHLSIDVHSVLHDGAFVSILRADEIN